MTIAPDGPRFNRTSDRGDYIKDAALGRHGSKE